VKHFSLVIAVVVSIALFLAGCGGGGGIAGTYTLDHHEAFLKSAEESMGSAGVELPKEAKEQLGKAQFTMTIKSDKTFTISATGMGPGQDEKKTGTWSEDGDRYKFTVEGDDDAYGTLEDGKLSLTFPEQPAGMKIVLKKK